MFCRNIPAMQEFVAKLLWYSWDAGTRSAFAQPGGVGLKVLQAGGLFFFPNFCIYIIYSTNMYIYIIYIDIISIYILVCCFRFPPCLLMILFGKNMWYSRKVLDEFGWVMFLAFFPGMFHDFGDSLKCFLGDSG